MKSSIFILFSLYFIVGNTAVAKSPSIKPDWEKISSYSINLSGREVSYKLPGKISIDFPQQIGMDFNVYDLDLFGDRHLFTVAKTYWDYKSRKLFFWDTIGTLSFRIAVFKTKEGFSDDISDILKFQNVMQNTLAVVHSQAKEIPIIEVNGNRWLHYIEKNRPSNPDDYIYLLPLTENRYLEVSFTIMFGDDQNRDNWYETSKSDIEKIINSFSVTFPK